MHACWYYTWWQSFFDYVLNYVYIVTLRKCHDIDNNLIYLIMLKIMFLEDVLVKWWVYSVLRICIEVHRNTNGQYWVILGILGNIHLRVLANFYVYTSNSKYTLMFKCSNSILFRNCSCNEEHKQDFYCLHRLGKRHPSVKPS